MWKGKSLWIATLMGLQVFFVAGFAWSAPSVTGVQGQVADGQTVAISGSGFGSGPTVVVFDDFESGTVGQQVQANSPEIGSYYSFGAGARPFISNAASVSGSKSMRADQSLHYSNHVGVLFPSPSTNVYASWWMFLPAGTNIPGESGSEGVNWKTVWLLGGGSDDDDLVLPTFLSATSFYINGNNALYKKYIPLGFQKGQWMRCSVSVNAGSPGSISYQKLTTSGGLQQILNDSSVTILKSGGAFERIHFNGYGRQTSNSYPTFDDIYTATGPNAQARIEIGNAATYAASTKLAIITPTSWNNSQINATVRQGVFRGGETAYFFVIDANGNPSPGFGPLTIGTTTSGGTSTPPTAPAPPQGLRLVPSN